MNPQASRKLIIVNQKIDSVPCDTLTTEQKSTFSTSEHPLNVSSYFQSHWHLTSIQIAGTEELSWPTKSVCGFLIPTYQVSQQRKLKVSIRVWQVPLFFIRQFLCYNLMSWEKAVGGNILLHVFYETHAYIPLVSCVPAKAVYANISITDIFVPSYYKNNAKNI